MPYGIDVGNLWYVNKCQIALKCVRILSLEICYMKNNLTKIRGENSKLSIACGFLYVLHELYLLFSFTSLFLLYIMFHVCRKWFYGSHIYPC